MPGHSIKGIVSNIIIGQPPPAIGDIRLEQFQNTGFYEVLVYFTDGIETPSWGAICSDVSAKVAGVICQQVGYTSSDPQLLSM